MSIDLKTGWQVAPYMVKISINFGFSTLFSLSQEWTDRPAGCNA